jgi:hypothetical protein
MSRLELLIARRVLTGAISRVELQARRIVMAHISFALLQAFIGGASLTEIAERLNLPEPWVQERIEAARLCLVTRSGLGDYGRRNRAGFSVQP